MAQTKNPKLVRPFHQGNRESTEKNGEVRVGCSCFGTSMVLCHGEREGRADSAVGRRVGLECKKDDVYSR